MKAFEIMWKSKQSVIFIILQKFHSVLKHVLTFQFEFKINILRLNKLSKSISWILTLYKRLRN